MFCYDMYKILGFGLFLICSLLMSALTFNVNLLSNAMAQEYDRYGDHIPPKIRSMNAEQVHLKGSL